MDNRTPGSTKALSLSVAAIIGFGITNAAPAALISGTSAPGPARAIPDDGYTGALTFPSVISSSITLTAPQNEPFVGDVAVTVAIDHSFVGDLTIHLQAPNGTVITLVNRPGLGGNPNDGTGVGGDSSNLSAAFPITFLDNAPSGMTAEQMGLGLSSSDIIGQIGPNNFSPFPDGAHGNQTLAALSGRLAAGTWTLHIGDSAAGATGSLTSWSISINTVVPTPGSLAILGLAGLTARRRRRT